MVGIVTLPVSTSIRYLFEVVHTISDSKNAPTVGNVNVVDSVKPAGTSIDLTSISSFFSSVKLATTPSGPPT